MAGVLSGLKVLDLSSGIAGPMTTMLLADHGAEVLKIEPPGGDRFAIQPGYRVWGRGKSKLALDLKSDADRAQLLGLAESADIFIESFRPGAAARLGVDYERLAERNPRLIYCSITGYGRDNPHAERPAYDALVAARTGLMWEQRGWPEGAEHHIAGREGFAPDQIVPQAWLQGPARPGPIFPSSRWPSLGAFFAASVGINAALRARGLTGRGQRVETSLLRGAMAAAWAVWQRAADPDAPNFATWVMNARSPKGHFLTADNRWIHQWAPNPRFVIEAAARGASPELNVKSDPGRLGMGAEELIAMAHFHEPMAESVAQKDAVFWLEAGRVAGMPLQVCRPVEEALADPLLLADGCVRQRRDPELGVIREVGAVYRLTRCDPSKLEATPAALRVPAHPKALWRPLDGIRVLDFGMAVAGPYGTQVLSDFGADVIKVGSITDSYWHETSIGYTCNRGKRSIQLNMKDARAADVVRRLVASADIVQHNMRYPAAMKLGLDYDSLRAIKPDLIYCHTRGHETGARDRLPGNDQTAASLAGIEYEDGAVRDGGKPMWSLTSFGDTGNGFLSAIAMIQALIHRDRTGEGQFVDTSIIYASLLNMSYTYAFADGRSPDRVHLDKEQLGLTALYRLYQTAQGWICIAITNTREWRGLCEALDAHLGDDPRFANAAMRAINNEALGQALQLLFAARPAKEWIAVLDAAGAPAEIVDPDFSTKLFDDPLFRERGWTVSFPRAAVGQIDMVGPLVDLSATPCQAQGAPLVSGANTRSILDELGYAAADVEALIAGGTVRQA